MLHFKPPRFRLATPLSANLLYARTFMHIFFRFVVSWNVVWAELFPSSKQISEAINNLQILFGCFCLFFTVAPRNHSTTLVEDVRRVLWIYSVHVTSCRSSLCLQCVDVRCDVHDLTWRDVKHKPAAVLPIRMEASYVGACMCSVYFFRAYDLSWRAFSCESSIILQNDILATLPCSALHWIHLKSRLAVFAISFFGDADVLLFEVKRERLLNLCDKLRRRQWLGMYVL